MQKSFEEYKDSRTIAKAMRFIHNKFDDVQSDLHIALRLGGMKTMLLLPRLRLILKLMQGTLKSRSIDCRKETSGRAREDGVHGVVYPLRRDHFAHTC